MLIGKRKMGGKCRQFWKSYKDKQYEFSKDSRVENSESVSFNPHYMKFSNVTSCKRKR